MTLRNRLIRLAHAQPSLRPLLIPILATDRVAAGPDKSGRNWKKITLGGLSRWVWSGKPGEVSFAVLEFRAPFGAYYKLQVTLADGTMLQTAGQDTEKEMWFIRAAIIYKQSQAVTLDFTTMPETWRRVQ